MKNRISGARLSALSLALGAAFSVQAQAAEPNSLPVMVVTGSRVPTPIADALADISVVDSETIARSGAMSLAELLSHLPGVEMTSNGGPGSTTSLFVRGSETRHTAVFIDGVRVDTQTTSGAPWESIPLAMVERIEVLRGPASGVYGSDTLGGVVQIITRRGEGGFTPFISQGVGTYGTAKTQAGFTGAAGAVDYALGVQHEQSKGFNAAVTGDAVGDDDGYRRDALNARLGVKLNAQNSLDATLLSSAGTTRYDGYLSTQDDRAFNRLQTVGANWKAQWNDVLSTTAGVSDSQTRYETTPSAYVSKSSLRTYLAGAEARVGVHSLSATLERREDKLDNSSLVPNLAERQQNGVALAYGLRTGQHTLQAQVRKDQDSAFGGKDTGSLAYGFAWTPAWRLTASTGTAFKAPSLYQLYSDYGVPTLAPESSRNVEFGARYTEGVRSWGVVAYRNVVRDLISYQSGPGPCAQGSGTYAGCYANVAQAEYAGVTLSGQDRFDRVNVYASLDLQDPRDKSTGKLLVRRATHHATLGANTSVATWTLGADAKLSSLRYDNAANTTELASYAVFDLYAQHALSKDWDVLVRLDNATDKNYQLANNYATAGRSLYVALTWAPK